MKRLLLFLIIVAVIGVGIFVLTAQEEDEIEPSDTKLQASDSTETSFFEPSETLIKNIITNALDVRFNAETATYKMADLDHKGGPELIIGAAAEMADPSATATIQVLTILNREGGYERIGKIEYQAYLSGIPEVEELTDIDGDGQDEIVMSLMYGGAASWTEGILNVDFDKKIMQWVQIRNEDGQVQDAIFLLAASTKYSTVLKIQDVDTDGRKEIVEISAQTLFDQPECEVSAYEWDNAVFAFDKVLSEQTLKGLGKDCAM